MRNFIQFIQYHNAVPVALSVLLLGAGGVFAATNPQAVYSSSQSIVSVDNSYLVQKDLATYSPSIQIESVNEDAGTYYVAYRLTTIDIDDFVWKDMMRTEVLKVSKEELGQYRDLGIYVTDIMKNIVARELQRLRETQESERSHVSQKVVATEYSGLIGKFLDTKTEQIPGYSPVVQPETAQQFIEVQAPSMRSTVPDMAQAAPEAHSNVPAPAPSSAPTLRVLGNNPTEIPVGATYSDLGAVLTSTPIYFAIRVYVNDVEVSQVSLDTAKTGEYVIKYRASNEVGETGEVTRLVRVVDPNSTQPTQTPLPSASAATTVPEQSAP